MFNTCPICETLYFFKRNAETCYSACEHKRRSRHERDIQILVDRRRRQEQVSSDFPYLAPGLNFDSSSVGVQSPYSGGGGDFGGGGASSSFDTDCGSSSDSSSSGDSGGSCGGGSD